MNWRLFGINRRSTLLTVTVALKLVPSLRASKLTYIHTQMQVYTILNWIVPWLKHMQVNIPLLHSPYAFSLQWLQFCVRVSLAVVRFLYWCVCVHMRVTYPKQGPFDKWAGRGWCGPINHLDLGLWQANKIKRPRCIGRRNMEWTRVTMTEASRHERQDSQKTHLCMQTQTWTCAHIPCICTLSLKGAMCQNFTLKHWKMHLNLPTEYEVRR